MKTETIRPNIKHYKKHKRMFIAHVVLFVLFCIATYYLRVWSFWMTMIFSLYILWYLVYLINHKAKKIILTDESLTYHSLFRNETFKVSEIKGHKWWYNRFLKKNKYDHEYTYMFNVSVIEIISENLESHIIIPTKASGKRKLKCFKSYKLQDWLRKNTTEIHPKEVKEVLDTQNDNKILIKKAKKFSTRFCYITAVIVFIHILIPIPMKLSFLASVICILYLTISVIKYKGYLRLEYPTAYPSVGYGIACLFGFFIFPFLSYHSINYPFKLPSPILYMAIGVNVLYIFFIGLKKFKLKLLIVPLFISFMFLSMLRISLNVLLDFSAPKIYETEISRKELKISERTRSAPERSNYEITLRPWRAMETFDHKISIDITAKNSELNIVDHLQIKEYPGFFNNPYFKVFNDGEELKHNFNLYSFLKNLLD